MRITVLTVRRIRRAAWATRTDFGFQRVEDHATLSGNLAVPRAT